MLVSIIIPIYGVEEYISGCIESILNQTYLNLEIILIDDGSKDNCPTICDEFSKKDERIIVIHKKNGGLSDARNVGIDKATGDYLMFVDGDDQIHPQMIELTLGAALKNNADIVISDYKKIQMPKKDYIIHDVVDEVIHYSGYEACHAMYTQYPFFVVACSKLYKRSLWKEVRFPFGKCHEDEFTSYIVFLNAKEVVYLPHQMYFYLQREGSIMNQSYSEKRLHCFEAMKEQICYFERKKLFEIQKKVYGRYFYFVAKGLESVDKKRQNYLYKKLKVEKRYILKQIRKSNLFSKDELKFYFAPLDNVFLNKMYWYFMKKK